MIFDFFKQRAEEGAAQIQNIARKTMEGKFQEAISDTNKYISSRQRADAENFQRLIAGLEKSRNQLLNGITGAFQQESQEVSDILRKLESTLLLADLGSSTTNAILSDLKAYSRTEKLCPEDIPATLRLRLLEALTSANLSTSLNFGRPGNTKPFVIFVIGANGMGKTTTIGKLAARLRTEANLSVIVGACDTFRAAAVEQLNVWTDRASVAIELPLEGERSGSPIPVLQRTLQRATEENHDVVIIDTAGRLSNNFELNLQLQEMKKEIQNVFPSAPHETLLVVDGAVGRNAIEQAKSWNKNVGVTGLVVTKMDGTARAGFVIATVKELQIPVKLIGVGEKLEDLRDFDAQVFVDALLGNDVTNLDGIKERAEKILATARSNRAKEEEEKLQLLQSSSVKQFGESINQLKNNGEVRKGKSSRRGR